MYVYDAEEQLHLLGKNMKVSRIAVSTSPVFSSDLAFKQMYIIMTLSNP